MSPPGSSVAAITWHRATGHATRPRHALASVIMDAGEFPRRRLFNWFFGTSIGALLAAVAYPIARYVSPPRIPEPSTAQIEAGDTNDPAFREKGFKIVRFGADPVIVVQAGDDDFKALSATCTHLDCIVGF